MSVTIETLFSRVETIRKSETVTKAEMSAFSREVLAFVIETGDVRPLNLLLGKGEDGKFTLTVANRKAANLFFKEFVGFSVAENDSDVVQFVKKKMKVWDKYVAKCQEFLADESNDIWTWIKANVEIEKKPPVYAEKLMNVVKKALNDNEHGISQVDILKSVLAGGVSIDALIALASEVATADAAE